MKNAFIVLSLMGFISSSASAQTVTSTNEKAKFTIADSTSFIGKYKYEGMPFEHIEVSVKEGKLFFTGGEYNGFLVPKVDSKDAFDVNNVAVFTFVRNNDNRIVELKVDYQGNSNMGKKEQKK